MRGFLVVYIATKVKVKVSLVRPVQALRAPGV